MYLLMSGNCGDCTLKGKKIHGVGGNNPDIVFVGPFPTNTDKRYDRPFSDQVGQVLRSACASAGLSPDQVYGTNLVLCHPPENREPSAKEIGACWPRLRDELEALNPKFIVACGAVPAKALFPGHTLKNDRGKILESSLGYEGIITYHPSATLFPKGDTRLPFIIKDLKKLSRILRGENIGEYSNPETSVWIVEDSDMMEVLLERLGELPDNTIVSLDWETTGVKSPRDVGFCLGLSWQEGTGVAIPAYYTRKYADKLNQQLERFDLTGYNACSFDTQFNKVIGLPDTMTHDAMLMHYMLDERPQQRSLENISVQELDAPPYESEMLVTFQTSKKTFIDDMPAEEIYKYCAKDVDWTLRLTNLFLPELQKSDNMYWVYENLLIPGAHTIRDIEQRGFWVDKEKLQSTAADYRDKIGKLEEELKHLTDNDSFNPRSSKQVQEHLWDHLGLDQPDIFGRDDRSADKATLDALQEQYPDISFLSKLGEYRSHYTLYSRYIRSLPQYIDPDNRVRTNIHMDRTETGRLSTSSPSLHQIPRESTIRSIYGAPPGYKLIQADYEQIEMRAAALVANDTKLIRLMNDLQEQGSDFHTYMASQAFQIPLEAVTKEIRQAAKVVSFGLLYLMSDEGLIVATGLPKQDAQRFIQSYKGMMPDVQATIEYVKQQIEQDNYVESIFGRRRRFPLITKKNLNSLYREGVNFALGQSPASDITLSSLIKLHEFLQTYYPEAGIVLTVHDSIMVECPDRLVGEVATAVKEIMENILPYSDVPFPVEVKVGQYWGEGDIV